MNISGMKKLLVHLERRLAYAIDITEHYEIQKRIEELRTKIVNEHKRLND